MVQIVGEHLDTAGAKFEHFFLGIFCFLCRGRKLQAFCLILLVIPDMRTASFSNKIPTLDFPYPHSSCRLGKIFMELSYSFDGVTVLEFPLGSQVVKFLMPIYCRELPLRFFFLSSCQSPSCEEKVDTALLSHNSQGCVLCP